MKKTSFEDKWTSVFPETKPISKISHPISGLIYQEWYRYIACPFIWSPKTDIDQPRDYYFCSNCEKWLFYGGTKNNITRHIKIHLNHLRPQEDNSINLDSYCSQELIKNNLEKTKSLST